MAAIRTIEQYVEEILQQLTDADYDSLTSSCDTLEKMKFSSKLKHKLNYWRVMQCLGEIGSDRLVGFLIKVDKLSCKCHLKMNFTCLMRLFLESMCNIRVIKRFSEHQLKIVPVLYRGVRQSEDSNLTALCLEAILRLLYVGRTDSVEFFVKYGLMKDIFLEIRSKCASRVFSLHAINVLLTSSQLLLSVSVCGTENIRKQVARSSAYKLFREKVLRMLDSSSHKCSILQLHRNFLEINKVLSDEKVALEAFKNWDPKEKLNDLQEQDQVYIFCSSPSCRKIYGECGKFRYCGACRLARYCTEACQKEHWKKGHKDSCQRARTDIG
ncbi:uncharacterized protein LOC127848794 isoform X2 [Dreissena polymorpha]|uniref:MYND-type domain-containing protein n=2 Tax=Dreissena polymorpha TaxID=45954 RepID=A0A9D4N3M0_DREPO|nr:uncharacterized protein LOC127848794 isoform X2 [Dreissena polymorpha]XP_052237391.1 uncharacterized protein LOC127848794 isoform X2 [Dreissena polymorpha]XP_052237398.1 uncharacterized protein LOC127848794 isoform X2 [Dreissena polymorpha]XP_052237406.1 uncharacterized protein LOC127848794 isoform X2 [Dreissena polymorpha]KAH3889027.1 hypothetical protein DPMN_013073 [Dreissena polymorpha]